MVILNPGARHCAFTFDEGNVMVPNAVQMLNAKGLAPKPRKISWVLLDFHFWLWALPMLG
jgi:hypothetical protein